MTCAHVVNVALGRNPRSQDMPDRAVRVEFPLLQGSGGRVGAITARVERWLAPPRAGAAGDDIACLRLADSALPSGAAPALLATAAPRTGQVVDVFGYPEAPHRPDGGWVEAQARGQVAGGRLQLDATLGAALRIQPGYSGSPVCERESGQVVGMLAAAPQAGALRDAYAIGVGQLLSTWGEVLDPQGTVQRRMTGQRMSESEVAVLHLSDPQFQSDHVPGEGSRAGWAYGALFGPLHDDLSELAADCGVQPDLVVVTGDLTAHGMPSEFAQALRFLTELTEATGLHKRHVAIVPGNHDVNRAACEAYFVAQQSREQEPTEPYWPKWQNFAELFEEFYADVPGAVFTPDEPWSLFEMPDLQVTVAGLNSTMAESHRDDDHYGLVSEAQLRWFASRLAESQRRGWLRLAVVHHAVTRGMKADDENLRDSDDLDQLLGYPSLANLLLNGQSRDSRLQRLPSGLAVLSTGGSAADTGAGAPPRPYKYQVVAIRPDSFTRYARTYASDRNRWIGSTSVSRKGSDWRETVVYPLAEVQGAFRSHAGEPGGPGAVVAPMARGVTGSEDDLLERVAEATRASHPDASITLRPDSRYLRVSDPLPGGGALQWPTGVIDVPDEASVRKFIAGVHSRFAAADPQLRSDLVYARGLPSEEVITLARRHGVRLRSLVGYQGLIDLRPLVAAQKKRITEDLRYPEALYVPQRFRALAEDPSEIRHGLLDQVVGWLDVDGPRFVMVLGEFGRGKTFLLRQLARCLPDRLPAMLPVLVELHGLEKAPSLDELLAQYLVQQGMQTVELVKLRYMVESGRLALLFDGFDELALRVSYHHAADYLQTLLGAVTGHAKIVLTSRTQHFQSPAQVRTALGELVATTSGSQVAVIEDFTDQQIRQFLVNHYVGDEVAALARFGLLDQVQDLLGLSHNPRMLSFIADLDETRLRQIDQQHGAISAAGLYREIIDNWLRNEEERQRHRTGLPSLDKGERFAACSALALRLWASTAPTIPLTDLSAEVAASLQGLAEHGYSADEAAHAVGSGTLLVSTADGSFTFVHPSVMEWLVANAAARQLRERKAADTLSARSMSRLMIDFLCDLAGYDLTREWAVQTLGTADATQKAKQNALKITARLGPAPDSSAAQTDLRDADLRGQDFAGRSFNGADLRGADLRDMRLIGTDFSHANLSGADLRGARLMAANLTGADISESRWARAALLNVSGIEARISAPEFDLAAIVGHDLTEAMVAQGGYVHCVAISPDGSLAALGRDDVLELADLSSGKTLRLCSGHTGPVNGVAFSPDGTLLATASADHTARIWDTTTGQARTILTGHTGPVNGVAFSPDGTLLATASIDRTARIWDTITGQARTILTGHTGPVNGVAFSPDGTLLATASADHSTRIWDTTTGQARTILTGHTGPVNGVAFSPDGTLLATASADHTARIWDTTTGQARTILTGHEGPVNGVAFSPDGTLLATASIDHTARIWDTTTGQARTILTGHDDWVNGVAFSADRDRPLVATASADRTARIWDTTTGQARTILTGHDNWVNGVAFSAEGTRLATASSDTTARIWDTTSGQARTILTGHTGPVNEVAFSPNRTLLATASADTTARIWDTTTGQARTILTGHEGMVRGVAFSPDGTLLATASSDTTARIWDTTTGQARTILTGHDNWVRGVAFSPDGTLLATASIDHTARIWDTTTGQARTILTGHTGPVNGVAFSPDGTLLATASADHSTRIWDTTTGQARTILTGHTGPVNGVAFSPDGTLLATASADHTARIWDTTTGQARTILTGHTGPVNGVAFSPDGTLLATASADGSARLWDTATGANLVTLLAFPEHGFALLLPDGSYKLTGDPRGSLWWAIKLCRFEPGELDPYVEGISKLPTDAKILGRG